MFDLLAAKGTIDILLYLAKYDKSVIKVSDLNRELQKQNLTTATIYRRIKELELAGLISRDEKNAIKLTKKGFEAIASSTNKGRIRTELTIRRASRRMLIVLERHGNLSITELQQYGFSPTTLQKSLEELKQNKLVETEKEPPSKAGRPKKKIKLTTKAKNYLKKQEELEMVKNDR
ncbi:MAG: hypothetical protein ACTSW1_14020 [Candidatus Hodarchaeales archaeon]